MKRKSEKTDGAKYHSIYLEIIIAEIMNTDSICGLVVRVPGYRSRGPG
jgi:hypothetical protein